MSFIPENVYIIYSSSSSGTVLNLSDGSPVNGTLCFNSTDESANIKTFDQQWLIKEVKKGSNTYTLRNLRGGTYLSLTTVNNANGTKVQGCQWEGDKAGSATDAKDQKWRIIPAGDNYRIQSVVAGEYIDIKGGDLTPGGIIYSSEHADTPTQQWRLHRVSRQHDEIIAMAKATPIIEEEFKNYMADGIYITLPQSVRDNLYNYKASGLRASKWRKDIFDCDDFSFVLKAEVAMWGNEFFRADGFAILFGIMFGRKANNGAHAYNWHLNEKLDKIVFFEPQTGTELADIGYKGYFGVF